MAENPETEFSDISLLTPRVAVSLLWLLGLKESICSQGQSCQIRKKAMTLARVTVSGSHRT